MRIVCPSCQHPTELGRADARAESFCPNCDYPLFWAVEQDHAAVERGQPGVAPELDPTLRRRPGSAGRRIPGEPCRECGEINTRRAVFCIRCGIELHPAPAPPPEPPAPPPPPPVIELPELPPAPKLPLLPIAAGVAGLVVLAGIVFGLEVFATLLVLAVAAAALVVAVMGAAAWR